MKTALIITVAVVVAVLIWRAARKPSNPPAPIITFNEKENWK
jgi:hypothetical protein